MAFYPQKIYKALQENLDKAHSLNDHWEEIIPKAFDQNLYISALEKIVGSRDAQIREEKMYSQECRDLDRRRLLAKDQVILGQRVVIERLYKMMG